MAVAIGLAAKADVNPGTVDCQPQRAAVDDAAPMSSQLGVAIPVTAVEKHIQAGADERFGDRHAIGIRTADDRHVAAN